MKIIEGSLKKGLKKDDSKVKCELIKKRERWVQYLQKQRNATTSKIQKNRDKTPPQKSVLSVWSSTMDHENDHQS